jgi:hypothetical protein
MMNSFVKSSQLLLSISFGAIALFPTQPSRAQTLAIPQPSQAPLELSLLRSGASVDGRVVTSNTISQQGLTVPSLWWAKEQFGSDLLDSWLAYPAPGTNPARIDLLVNRQNWSALDYIQRYEFINHFGIAARDYGYNLRVFNEQKELLATYTCDFSTNPSQCNIQLDATGKARIRGSKEGLGAGG